MSLILNGTTGISDVDGTAAAPALTGTDTNTGIFFPAADTIAFAEGGVESMRIDSAGDVGIGTTSPSYKLHVVNAAGGDTIVLDNGGGAGDGASTYLAFSGTNTGANFVRGRIRGAFPDATGGGLAFETGTSGSMSERARIDSSGNLLVGTTTASGKITASTAVTNSRVLSVASTSASYADIQIKSVSAATAGTNWYHFVGYSSNEATNNIFIYGNGNVVNANNSYGAMSDAKLKENVTDATPKLDKLQQVRVVNYNLIGEKQKQLGVIAQELEQIFPSMIDESPDRDAEGNDLGTITKSVKYSVFVPMLIKAIQEQQALITALTTRITALEAA